MRVRLQNVTKKFQNHSVFKNVNLDLPDSYRGVILGGNGSGKSTLLKVISTAMLPSKGDVQYFDGFQEIVDSSRFKHVSFCAPYIDLIEDFTLLEHIDFQQKFRPFINNLKSAEIIERLGLARFKNNALKTYSSGMKQRVRLMLAICSDTSLLLLDEPTSNLDPKGKQWYQELIKDFSNNRSIIVGSNFLDEEFFFTKNTIELKDYQ